MSPIGRPVLKHFLVIAVWPRAMSSPGELVQVFPVRQVVTNQALFVMRSTPGTNGYGLAAIT